MSVVDEALKVLETPESEGGLADYEKILVARDILRAAPVAEPASATPIVEVPAISVAPVVDAPQPPVQ